MLYINDTYIVLFAVVVVGNAIELPALNIAFQVNPLGVASPVIRIVNCWLFDNVPVGAFIVIAVDKAVTE